MHHGIEGMHWGIRRFQNKDGTRTPEGKERYKSSNKEDANKLEFSLFGRKQKLDVIASGFYNDGKLTSGQKKVKASLKNVKFNSALGPLRKYIQDNDSDYLKEYDPSDHKIKNPYRYVKPKDIYISSDLAKKNSFAMLCNYRFDPEHGIAIIYENGKCKHVVHQDYVL